MRTQEIFMFFSKNLLKGILAFIAIIIALLILKHFVDKYNLVFLSYIKDYPLAIYSLFLINEISLGILPPEIFMMLYTAETPEIYWKWISLMTLLAYLSGSIAFLVGIKIKKTIWYNNLTKQPNIQKYLFYYKRFDGALLSIAAMTPLPFSIISIISGATGHTFLHFVKYSFPFRFIRFFAYGYLLYNAFEADWVKNIFTLF